MPLKPDQKAAVTGSIWPLAYLKTQQQGSLMTTIDLSEMSLRDLKLLSSEVAIAINGFEERRRKDAISALEAVAKEKGFNLAELTNPKKARTAVKAKYQHPENPEVTWSGRGRRPAWFNEALDRGISQEDLRIA